MADAAEEQMADTVQGQILTLFQQLVANQPTATATSPATAIKFHRSSYDGDTIDVLSRFGSGLFERGSGPLPAKFSGAIQEIATFISHLRDRARLCRWDSATHDILTITVNQKNYNILNDYGRISKADVETARTKRIADGTERSQQNSQMMYEAINASITGTAHQNLISKQTNSTFNLHEDGPTLFYEIMSSTFTTTFTYASTLRIKLQTLSPKDFDYDISAMNNHVTSTFAAIDTVTSVTITQDEIMLYALRAYKLIKVPREWVAEIEEMERKLNRQDFTSMSEMLDSANGTYQRLKASQLWKPSLQTEQEQFMAMFVQKTAPTAELSEDNKKDQKKRPPFLNSKGKEGDTKKWKQKTYYYCDSNHRNGHWVLHKPTDCKLKQEDKPEEFSNTSSPTPDEPQVQVDDNRIRAMQALLDSAASDDVDPIAIAQAAIALARGE
mmetsp:Transcript_26701/g.37854  ORF Transcript_26701/g.37854 Transcript_26701/m.37854 type:complete len:442 (+) Transcript_26701:1524-2849(+)